MDYRNASKYHHLVEKQLQNCLNSFFLLIGKQVSLESSLFLCYSILLTAGVNPVNRVYVIICTRNIAFQHNFTCVLILTSLLCEPGGTCWITPILLVRKAKECGGQMTSLSYRGFCVAGPISDSAPLPTTTRLMYFLSSSFHIRMSQNHLKICCRAFLSWFEKRFFRGLYFNHNVQQLNT